MSLDYSGGNNVITGVLKRRKRETECQHRSDRLWGLSWPLLALKIKGGREPRNVGGLWKLEKAKKNDSPQDTPEGMQPSQHPDFSPSETCVRFLTSRIVKQCICVLSH